jgi:hypothetical protein
VIDTFDVTFLAQSKTTHERAEQHLKESCLRLSRRLALQDLPSDRAAILLEDMDSLLEGMQAICVCIRQA